MGQYDAQQACLNGHQITDAFYGHPQFRKDFCTDCGEKTIYQCRHCQADIRGHYDSSGVITTRSAKVPTNCHECGNPYPWTERKQTTASATQSQPTPDVLILLRQVLQRVHLVVRQLRARHDSRPTLDVTDEYDVQDLLHALLQLFFEDIRTEEHTPSYAGKASRMDFLLKKEAIVLEVKMTRSGLTGKEVGTQLIEDIARYQAHPDCKRLVCFVYDPEGRVKNPRGLETDLSKGSGDIEVEVVVIPRGH